MTQQLCNVLVFSYINPVRLQPVNSSAPWYSEGKIVDSGYNSVIALNDGYRVQYSVMVYTFRKVAYQADKLTKLIEVVKDNDKKRYIGWLHHANVYERKPDCKKGRFLERINIDCHL